jgi:hypothetical protein
VPVAEDTAKVITSGLALAAAGASVSVSALMERAGIPAAKDESDRIGAVSQTEEKKTEDRRQEAVANAAVPELPAWMDALSADLQPLGKALESAMRSGDDAAMRAALKKISAGMPEFMETAGLEDYLRDEFITALGGEGEEVENGDFSGHPFRGNQWGNRPKGTGKPKRAREVGKISEVLEAAFADPDNRDFADYQRLGIKESAAIIARAGRPPAGVEPLEGCRRTLEAEKAMKILSKHSADKYPVTEEDFKSLPILLNAPAEQKWESKAGQTPRLVSTIRNGRDLLIVEEVQTGNRRLTVLSMYRP